MAGDLLALPIRLGFRAASFAVRTGLQASERAFGLASVVAKVVIPDDRRPAENASSPAHEAQENARSPANEAAPVDSGPSPAASEPTAPEPAAPEASAPEPAAPEAAAPEPAPPEATAPDPRRAPPTAPAASAAGPAASSSAEPKHVTEEPTLVAAFAEPGAEDGAGANVTVDEPWEGYAKANAPEILARLAGAPPEELAAVSLYETVNRNREMVITAVEQQLRKLTGGATAAATPTRKEPTDGA